MKHLSECLRKKDFVRANVICNMLWKSPHVAIILTSHHVKLHPYTHEHMIAPQPYTTGTITMKTHELATNAAMMHDERKIICFTKETHDMQVTNHTNEPTNV